MKNMGEGYFRLTPEEFEEIINKGFIIINPYPGKFKKITLDDILISEDDVNKILEEKKQ
jgi:hypothetical protein